MKKIVRLTEQDLARIVRQVIRESVCDKFVKVSKLDFNDDVKNMTFGKDGDTDEAKSIVSRSKTIYRFLGTTSDANKNLNCIGLTMGKSNYDYYVPKNQNYFYIGVY